MVENCKTYQKYTVQQEKEHHYSEVHKDALVIEHATQRANSLGLLQILIKSITEHN